MNGRRRWAIADNFMIGHVITSDTGSSIHKNMTNFQIQSVMCELLFA